MARWPLSPTLRASGGAHHVRRRTDTFMVFNVRMTIGTLSMKFSVTGVAEGIPLTRLIDIIVSDRAIL